MRLVVLLQARDEERFIPGWLTNIGDLVDGIIALDDGSTDDSAALLRAHPKLIELIEHEPGMPWDERANQNALVQAARRHDAEWILCLDADERLELAFVEDAHDLLDQADRDGVKVFRFDLRECWDDPCQFRVDGIWGMKKLCRLFRNDPAHRRFDPRTLHRFWMPLELVADLETVARDTERNIYHLRMIEAADREARLERYERLDPGNRFQPIGYRYLTDATGMELQRITHDRRYVPCDGEC
jgi:glycosyltransferase involved in cell wall biosynthesis